MRSLRPVTALASRPFAHRVILAFILTLILSFAATAQQPPAGRPKPPRLTTDDVARPPAQQPSTESKEAVAKPEEAKAGAADSKDAQPKTGESKVSAEESSWRERVTKARERAKQTQRAAEEGELRVTELRNELGRSGQGAGYRNSVASEMDLAGQRVKELRAQASAAADDLAQLVEYGKQKGFTEAEDPKPVSEEGKPNEEFYRAEFTKLNEGIESAQRRIQLYDNRVRDLSQRILMNGGKNGGDNFYMAQLQKDREDAQHSLDEARAALTKAQTDLETLIEQARRAGVPPGLFR